MKFTLVTTVLLGLLLTPALSVYFQNQGTDFTNGLITINVGLQVLTINREWHVATIEQNGPGTSWRTIWNYDLGFIATKILPEGTCYISVMNRRVMPSFDALPSLAQGNRNLKGQIQPSREITYTISRTPVNDLSSYGQDIIAMCGGFTAFMAYEVPTPQYTYNQGSCIRLDVLQLLEINYCRGNTKI